MKALEQTMPLLVGLILAFSAVLVILQGNVITGGFLVVGAVAVCARWITQPRVASDE